ncbi:hypothetical protein Tco_1502554 [Tanacetum coccineum]
MMNYLKNQGTWKLSQLKNLSFEEVKDEFDKLVKQVESFAPMNLEATKASLKRFGEELQTKTMKRLKDDEAKDAEPTKKFGKRRKQMARKGLHTDLDKDDSEGSDEVSEQDDSVTCTKTPINPVPVAMKSPNMGWMDQWDCASEGSKRMMEMMPFLIAMEAKLVDGYSGIDAYDVWNGHGLMVLAMKVMLGLRRRFGSAD